MPIEPHLPNKPRKFRGEELKNRLRAKVEADAIKRGRPPLPEKLYDLLADVEASLDLAEEREEKQLSAALSVRKEELERQLEKSMAYWRANRFYGKKN